MWPSGAISQTSADAQTFHCKLMCMCLPLLPQACQSYGFDMDFKQLPDCWQTAIKCPSAPLIVDSAKRGNEVRLRAGSCSCGHLPQTFMQVRSRLDCW